MKLLPIESKEPIVALDCLQRAMTMVEISNSDQISQLLSYLNAIYMDDDQKPVLEAFKAFATSCHKEALEFETKKRAK